MAKYNFMLQESIEAIRSQSASSPYDDIEDDALTWTFENDKRGRLGGVESHISKIKLQHSTPIVDEMSWMRNRVLS